MKFERNAAPYVISFILPIVIFLGMLVGLSVYLEPVEGDLARLGHWAERDFRSRVPQPIDSVNENGVSITHPTALVLGDSFSRPNIWQSHVAQTRNIEILSYYFKDVGCLHNWVRWVSEKPYPTVKTIIIETVEREFVPRFGRDHACPSANPKPFEMPAHTVESEQGQFALIKDANYLWETLKNSITMEERGSKIVSGKVVNVSLNTGGLFSNRKSNRLLFYRTDESKQDWTKSDISMAIARLEKIQSDLDKVGLRLVVVVIPDKSTIYAPYFSHEKDKVGYPDIFTPLAESRVNTVNLMHYFQRQLVTTVDLYKPNDTHLSQSGYRLMAAKVADQM